MSTERESKQIINDLLVKVKNGEITRDITDPSVSVLEREVEAAYFAKCREFRKTKNAHAIFDKNRTRHFKRDQNEK